MLLISGHSKGLAVWAHLLALLNFELIYSKSHCNCLKTALPKMFNRQNWPINLQFLGLVRSSFKKSIHQVKSIILQSNIPETALKTKR